MNNEEGVELKKALIECPKCESNKTEYVKKVSFFDAISALIIGFIFAFIRPAIIVIKVFLYIVSYKISKIKRLIIDNLWGYIVTIKCCLIVFTFGFVNLTEVYRCKDCNKRWTI